MVIIDGPFESKGRMWSHLTASTRKELHEFANRLYVKQCWYHQGRSKPHYDIKAELYENAIRLGAIPVSSKELLIKIKEWYG